MCHIPSSSGPVTPVLARSRCAIVPCLMGSPANWEACFVTTEFLSSAPSWLGALTWTRQGNSFDCRFEATHSVITNEFNLLCVTASVNVTNSVINATISTGATLSCGANSGQCVGMTLESVEMLPPSAWTLEIQSHFPLQGRNTSLRFKNVTGLPSLQCSITGTHVPIKMWVDGCQFGTVSASTESGSGVFELVDARGAFILRAPEMTLTAHNVTGDLEVEGSTNVSLSFTLCTLPGIEVDCDGIANISVSSCSMGSIRLASGPAHVAIHNTPAPVSIVSSSTLSWNWTNMQSMISLSSGRGSVQLGFGGSNISQLVVNVSTGTLAIMHTSITCSAAAASCVSLTGVEAVLSHVVVQSTNSNSSSPLLVASSLHGSNVSLIALDGPSLISSNTAMFWNSLFDNIFWIHVQALQTAPFLSRLVALKERAP